MSAAGGCPRTGTMPGKEETVAEAIATRRTTRRFDLSKPVPRALIEKIIDAGRHAPSACNYQNWFFLPVDDRATLDRLHFVGTFHAKLAPVNIFVFYDQRPAFINAAYADHVQSASAATMTMVLAAHALGLGSDWVCDLPAEGNVKAILGVPKRYRLMHMLSLGYSAQASFPPKKLKELPTIMSWNRYAELPQAYTGMYQPGYHDPPFVRKWVRRFFVWLYLRTGNERWMRAVDKLKAVGKPKPVPTAEAAAQPFTEKAVPKNEP